MLTKFNYKQIKEYIEKLGFKVKGDIYLCEDQRDFMLSVCLEGDNLQSIKAEEFQTGPIGEAFCLVSEEKEEKVKFDFFLDFDIYKEYVVGAYLEDKEYNTLGLYWVSKFLKEPLRVDFSALITARNRRETSSYLIVRNFGVIENGNIACRVVSDQPSNLPFNSYKFYEDLEPDKNSKYDLLPDLRNVMGGISLEEIGLCNMLELVAYEGDDIDSASNWIYDLFPRYYTTVEALEEAAVYFKRNPAFEKYGIAVINNNSVLAGTVNAEAGTVEWEEDLVSFFEIGWSGWFEEYVDGLGL